jgi:hypothetical protein
MKPYEADGERDRHKHRTVLFIGDSTSDMTALINTFTLINNVLDVNLEDPFRFQLIDPPRGDNQSGVTVYDVRQLFLKGNAHRLLLDDHRYSHSPSYVDGHHPEKHVEISQTIGRFFDVKNGIHQLNMIGFAVDSKFPNLMPTHFYLLFSDGRFW